MSIRGGWLISRRDSAISALQVAMGDSKSVAFAQHRNKEAFPRFLAGMAGQ